MSRAISDGSFNEYEIQIRTRGGKLKWVSASVRVDRDEAGTPVTFTGTYTENGTFVSDPADNYFTDLIVGTNGRLTGGTQQRRDRVAIADAPQCFRRSPAILRRLSSEHFDQG